MIKKNHFSIIIPVFNGEHFIKDCLDSVLAQSYSKYEVIIINDCSTDNTQSILNKFNKIKKIKILSLNKNVGCSLARNIGLKHASGNFISFIDADDSWHVDMLKEQYKKFMMGYDLVHTSYRRIYTNSSELIVKAPIYLTENKMMFSNFIANSSASYNRVKLGLFFYKNFVRVSSDYVYWLDIFKKKPNNIGIQKVLMNYRVHASSISADKFNTFKEVWLIHRNYLHHNYILSFIYISLWFFYAIKKRTFIPFFKRMN